MATDTGTGTDTAEVTGELTADDIAALRTPGAEYSAHHWQGKGYIRAYLRKHAPVPIFTAREQRLFPESGPYGDATRQRTIYVETGVSGYTGRNGAGTWRGSDNPRVACFFTPYDGTLPSIAHIVRPGDILCLSWLADNNNDVTVAAGYHADQLHAIVKRAKGARLTFLLGSQVGPDNSARMVRRYG